MKYGLTDRPKMPKRMAAYQGMTLQDFAAHHPLLLLTAVREGGWEFTPEAKAALFPSQVKIKQQSKNFQR